MCNLINTHPHAHALQRVPASGGRSGSTTSPAMILFCFKAGTFIPHASSSLQTGSCAFGHPRAPFARTGVCTRVFYRGVNQIRGTGRGERGRERGGNRDGNGIAGGEGVGNGDGDGGRAGTGTGVKARERMEDGSGNGDGIGDEKENQNRKGREGRRRDLASTRSE